MTYTQDQISAALLAGERHWAFRYDIVKPDGSVSGTANVVRATVNNDDLADKIKRTALFTIDYASQVNYITDRLRPYARLRMPDGGWQEWPVGTFYLSTPSRKWEAHLRDGSTVYETVAENLSVPQLDSGGVGVTALGTRSLDTGYLWQGVEWFHAGANTAGDNPIVRNYVDLARLTNGAAYSTGITLGNPTSAAITVEVDWCDLGNVSFTLSPGEVRHVEVGPLARGTYNSTYHFVDATTAAEFLFREWIVVAGDPAPYFDGDTPSDGIHTFAWTGTANASTSVKQLPSPTTVVQHAPLTVDVTGYDGLQVLVDDAVTDRYVVAAGTAYTDAVNSVLTGAGFSKPQVSSSATTLPAAREWPPGTSKLTIVNDLLASLNYTPLRMTPLGDPTSGPYRPPEQEPPVWSYTIDRQSVIVPGIDVALDTFGIPNVWVATVSEPDRPVLTATATNDDPNSPLSTVSRGRKIVATVDGSNAADQATLNALVAQAKAAASQQYEVATFTTGLMPFHDSGDVVMLDYGAGAMRFRSHTWSMELKAGGRMQHVVRRVVSL